MPISAGQRLGPYEILAPIGAGGMGEVYRAADTRLKRDVALKFLPEAFVRDAGRMARFQREAEVLASLNHPNITAIYGIEDSSGSSALVMELAEGITLAERIQQGPVPLDEALHIAGQIAAGLEYAHEKNIVHRDLKPSNVKITPRGTVKILDFGLAKAFNFSEDPSATADPYNSPTLTMGQTLAGVILGSAGHMAPEQARGKVVDKRADIWAFGVVLYEMLTGARLFLGEDVTETLAAVIKEEPRWERVPQQVRPLLRRCLEKDPKRRLRDIGDAMPLAEAGAAAQEHAPAQPATAQSRRGWLAWSAAGLSSVIAGAALPVAFKHLREQPAAAEPVRFDVQPPPKTTFGTYLALSPNGRHLAFTATGPEGSRIWVRDLDKAEARPLAGTENANSMIWSPDSRFIAFGSGNQLKKSEISSGSPVTLCESPYVVEAGSWSKHGVILFFGTVSGTTLQRVPEAGGAPAPVTVLDRRDELAHLRPDFLPDGRHFVYGVVGGRPGIYLGSLDSKPNQQPSNPLLSPYCYAVYAPSMDGGAGDLLFPRGGTLMAQTFDLDARTLVGQPVPVAERVGDTLGSHNYSVSLNGILAYRAGSAVLGRELVWMDRTGKRLGIAAQAGQSSFEALSPDGKTVALVLTRQAGVSSDIWLYDLGRTTMTRFTFGPGTTVTPIWSPDGSQIAYGANHGAETGDLDIYRRPARTVGQEQLMLRVGSWLRLNDWSRDGKTIVYVPDYRQADLWLLPMQGDPKPAAYLQSPFGEYNAQFSPDGRWMAYTSDESGREEVYVQAVPATGAKWPISTAGGSRARWRRDGKELFYLAGDQRLMSVAVQAGATFEAGIPQPLFQTSITSAVQPHQFFYTPSPDGQKFLLTVPTGDAAPAPITVVLNWRAGLRK